MRILRLDPTVANQIAAGEVIERPASVVKELLENALDAKASKIVIEVGHGGLNSIKVSDNGQGIVAEDLPLAIAPHATSKIALLEDLQTITSMGFRGEALASIASIAKVSINSRPSAEAQGMSLAFLEGKLILVPCARGPGTTVEVRDLFFNAPVRKKFLKSERIEFQVIETVVKRFAFCEPTIAIELSHNGRLVLQLSSAIDEESRCQRISKIFGKAFLKSSISLDVDHPELQIAGFVTDLSFQRSQNDKLWVYMNGRMLRDKLINHAIKQAYEGFLHPGRHPACLLYLTMSPDRVDVNVHPTKHEVRFRDPRLIHDLISLQIHAVLECVQKTSKVAARSAALPIPRCDLSFDPLESQWLALNSDFAIVRYGKEAYLVDVLALQKHWLRQAKLPLESRPLLVPVYVPAGQEEMKEVLQGLGIRVEAKNSEWLIRSLPICVPNVDIQAFFASIEKGEAIGVDLLVSHQNASMDDLSADLQQSLGCHLQKIITESTIEGHFVVHLSKHNCQNLLGSVDNSTYSLRPAACPRDPWMPRTSRGKSCDAVNE